MGIKHWIGGREVDSPETFTTFNPATGQPIAEVASAARRKSTRRCAPRRTRFRNGQARPRRSARS